MLRRLHQTGSDGAIRAQAVPRRDLGRPACMHVPISICMYVCLTCATPVSMYVMCVSMYVCNVCICMYSQVSILRYAFTFHIHHTYIHTYIHTYHTYRLAPPLSGQVSILRYAFTFHIHHTHIHIIHTYIHTYINEFTHTYHTYRLAPPLSGQVSILHYAFTFHIHDTQVVLSLRVPLHTYTQSVCDFKYKLY